MRNLTMDPRSFLFLRGNQDDTGVVVSDGEEDEQEILDTDYFPNGTGILIVPGKDNDDNEAEDKNDNRSRNTTSQQQQQPYVTTDLSMPGTESLPTILGSLQQDPMAVSFNANTHHDDEYNNDNNHSPPVACVNVNNMNSNGSGSDKEYRGFYGEQSGISSKRSLSIASGGDMSNSSHLSVWTVTTIALLLLFSIASSGYLLWERRTWKTSAQNLEEQIRQIQIEFLQEQNRIKLELERQQKLLQTEEQQEQDIAKQQELKQQQEEVILPLDLKEATVLPPLGKNVEETKQEAKPQEAPVPPSQEAEPHEVPMPPSSLEATPEEAPIPSPPKSETAREIPPRASSETPLPPQPKSTDPFDLYRFEYCEDGTSPDGGNNCYVNAEFNLGKAKKDIQTKLSKWGKSWSETHDKIMNGLNEYSKSFEEALERHLEQEEEEQKKEDDDQTPGRGQSKRRKKDKEPGNKEEPGDKKKEENMEDWLESKDPKGNLKDLAGHFLSGMAYAALAIVVVEGTNYLGQQLGLGNKDN